MDCLVLPVAVLRRRYSGSRLGYRLLSSDGDFFSESDDPVTVLVGKERREFVVDDPYVLEGNPIRVLIDLLRKDYKGRVEVNGRKRVIYVDVDAILFEHMLWLMHNNDICSLLKLNLKEIIDFYADQDI